MKTYFISDHHFCHRNIIGYTQRNFSDIKLMNQFMIYKWNSIVTPEDLVIYGGDFCLASKKTCTNILSVLNKKEIILVKGNHDGSTQRMLDIGFNSVVDKYETDQFIVRHNPRHFDAEEELDSNKILIHGHIHNSYELALKGAINICVEPLDFEPKTLDQLISMYGVKSNATVGV